MKLSVRNCRFGMRRHARLRRAGSSAVVLAVAAWAELGTTSATLAVATTAPIMSMDFVERRGVVMTVSLGSRR